MMEMSAFVRWVLGVGLSPRQELELDYHAIHIAKFRHIPQARIDALEEAAKAAEHWGSFFPTSVFPENGTSVDCVSAAMGRQAAKQIALAIRALKEQDNGSVT